MENYVTTGAAYNRRRAKRSPLEVLQSIVDRDHTASREHLFSKWRDLIEGDGDLLTAVLDYSFTNFYSALERTAQQPAKQSKQQLSAAVDQRRKQVQKLAKQFKAQVLLDWTMLNGKRMKDCTFAEMSTFGDMFKLIAAQGKPSQIVGEVLKEADVRRLVTA